MSEVIRKAIVELELRLKKDGLQAPDLSATTKAFEQQAAAAKNVETQTKAASRAVREYSKSYPPEDFQKLFKSMADAKKYAYQQMGPLGPQILKEDPAFVASLKRIDIENGAAVEEFGKKASSAYARGLYGITEFGRGLALLANDGSENAQKLLKSIVAIQGATDAIRGGIQMTRLGPELGAAAAAVAVLAGSWLLYSQQVERSKKQLEGLREEYGRMSQAQSKYFTERDKLAAQAQAQHTDSEQVPSSQRAAREAELLSIRKQRRESADVLANTERSRLSATLTAEKYRSEATLYPESRWQDFLMYGPSESFQNGGERVAYHNQLLEEAKRQGGRAKEYGQAALSTYELQMSLAERERSIFEVQKQDEYTQLQERHKNQLDLIGTLPSKDGPQGFLNRQQQLFGQIGGIAATQAIGGIAGGMFGAVNNGNMIAAQEHILWGIQRGQGDVAYGSERNRIVGLQDSETRQVQEKWTAIFKAQTDLIEQLGNRIAKLKNDLQAANPN